MISVLVDISRIGDRYLEFGVGIILGNAVTLFKTDFGTILDFLDRIDAVGIGFGCDALAALKHTVRIFNPSRGYRFGNIFHLALGLRLGDYLAARGDGGIGIGRPDTHDVLGNLLARVLIRVQVDGNRGRDIKVHQALSVAVEIHRLVVFLFFVDGQRTGADDVQACAVFATVIECPDITQLARALDVELEVVAHVIDRKGFGQLDVAEGQGVCRLVIGRAGNRLVIDHDRARRRHALTVIDQALRLTFYAAESYHRAAGHPVKAVPRSCRRLKRIGGRAFGKSRNAGCAQQQRRHQKYR